MPLEGNIFVMAVIVGLIIGSINGYFHGREAGRRAGVKRFGGWLIAFVITGIIITPFAHWLLVNVL